MPYSFFLQHVFCVGRPIAMSDDKILNFRGVTRHNLDPQRVLDEAKDKRLQDVIVIGFDQDGDEYFASSVADGGTVNWLIDRAKMKLLKIPDDLS